MKMKHSVVSWLAGGLICVACSQKENAPATEKTQAVEKTPAVEKLHWLTDFDAAKAQARSENKMLLINFTGSDWCPPCIMLEKQVLSQPEFAHYAAKHLVLMEVDFPRRKKLPDAQKAANEKVAGQYGIEGFPTIAVLDPSGKPVGALGYVPDVGPAEFVAELEQMRVTE